MRVNRYLNNTAFLVCLLVCTVRAHVPLHDVQRILSSHTSLSAKQAITLLWALRCEDTDAFIYTLVERYKDPEYTDQHTRAFIQHCRSIHTTLKHLYVDQKEHALVYAEKAPRGLPSLKEYWKKQNARAYIAFYRMYADVLSVALIHNLHYAYCSIDETEWKDYGARAQIYFNECKNICHFFAHSEYEQVYAQAIQLYQELLNLLRQEQARRGLAVGICITQGMEH